MLLDPIRNAFQNNVALLKSRFVVEERPLGVEPDVFDLVATIQFGHPFFDGSLVLHDDLQLVSLGQVFVEGQSFPLGGKGNPVEVAADGKGAAGLQMDGEGTNAEGVSEFVEIVHGWF